MSDSDEIEIAGEVKASTDKAVLWFDGKTEAWVPRSQITDYCEEKGKWTSIFLREWLAIEKGFV